jgi:rhamnosyltransferase
MNVALCVPTLNPGALAAAFLSALAGQTRKPDTFIVIDSESTDQSRDAFADAGATVHVIKRGEFDHGATRQWATTLCGAADIVVFLTQDAVLADAQALQHLVACFDDQKVAAAYGRQLPRQGAGPIEAHARLFNYPAHSRVKTMADAAELGIKTAFISNSFAAYRLSALRELGGFPQKTILGEDTFVAAKMLMRGWAICYRADACVYHSHDYTIGEEFRRYFDTGVFHQQMPWIRERFGEAEGEGMRYMRSELSYLWREAPQLIPSAIVRNVAKLAGFRLGRFERMIPLAWKRRLSMNRGYWKQ